MAFLSLSLLCEWNEKAIQNPNNGPMNRHRFMSVQFFAASFLLFLFLLALCFLRSNSLSWASRRSFFCDRNSFFIYIRVHRPRSGVTEREGMPSKSRTPTHLVAIRGQSWTRLTSPPSTSGTWSAPPPPPPSFSFGPQSDSLSHTFSLLLLSHDATNF